MRRENKAFTLVELLVAMAIIGVLIGLALFGMAAAQRAQRDSERKSAIQDLNLGIQQFYETNNTMPTGWTNSTGTTVVFTGTGTSVTVPLRGNAVSDVAAACSGALITTYASANNTTHTCYCFDSAVTAGVGGIGGYAICGRLENGSVTCAGSGASVGNTVKLCNGAGNSYLIP